jgi:signal peptidase I
MRSASRERTGRSHPPVGLCLGAAVLLGAVVGTATRAWAVSPVRVTSNSMSPAMDRGDWAVVSKLDRSAVRRGDVVLFRYPLGTSGRAVKRVVALGGDRVEISFHSVRVNGHVFSTAGAPDAVQPHALTVPHGHVFLLGDNGAASWDSRGLGPVPQGELLGRVRVVIPALHSLALPALATLALIASCLGLLARRRRRPRLGRPVAPLPLVILGRPSREPIPCRISARGRPFDPTPAPAAGQGEHWRPAGLVDPLVEGPSPNLCSTPTVARGFDA